MLGCGSNLSFFFFALKLRVIVDVHVFNIVILINIQRAYAMPPAVEMSWHRSRVFGGARAGFWWLTFVSVLKKKVRYNADETWGPDWKTDNMGEKA